MTKRVLAGAVLLLAVACRGARDQSVLAPNGARAESVENLWWFALGIAVLVYVATIGTLGWAGWRARQRERRGELRDADEGRRMRVAVTGAVAATVVILLVFFGADLVVGRTIRTPVGQDHLLVKVTGYQWWWKVEYPDTMPQGWITDANEIHVPVGRPVLVELTSNDVIHSLWIPNLGGKKDLIPRYKDTLWFEADRPGVFRSQCAEFCGHQHAKMALHVVVHEPEEFTAWQAASRQWARTPTDTLAARGQEVFMAGRCVLCHAIAGTPAGSRVGPDLTHIASRRTLGAGTLANTRGNLAAWITDPQGMKPGANMPTNALSPADLEALLTYLGTLK